MTDLIKEISMLVYRILESDFLISLFIKSTIILGLAFIIQNQFKNYSATIKHSVWNLAFVAILIVSIVPSGKGSMHIKLYDRENFTSESLDYNLIEPTYVKSSREIPGAAHIALVSDKIKTDRFLSIMDWAVFIWSLGVVLLLLVLLFELLWVWWISHRARSPGLVFPDHILTKCKRSVGLNRNVRILLSGQVSAPLTFGYLFPTIVLPGHAALWSEEKLRIVLLHEIIHIKRGDYLTNWLVNLSVILCWYNPLIWRTINLQRLECEKACDELVVSNNIKPGLYAMELLQVTYNQPKRRYKYPKLVIGILGASGLRSRIRHILNFHQGRKTLSRNTSLLLVFSGVLITVILSSFQFHQEIGITSLKELLRQVRQPDRDVRLNAAMNLVPIKKTGIIEPIQKVLVQEKDPEIKVHLISSIGKFGMSSTFGAIAQSINTNDQMVKIQALKSLNLINCFPSYLLIESHLGDAEAQVRKTAQDMLLTIRKGKLKTSIREFCNILKFGPDKRSQVVVALDGIEGYEVIDEMKAIYLSKDAEGRQKVADKLLTATKNEDFGQLKEIISKAKLNLN